MRGVTADTKLCTVIGYPMAGTLSPLMHNAAYKELGIEDKFVFMASRVRPEELNNAMLGVRALGIRGVSCTMPHKQAVIAHLDEINEVAERIGAVNTVVNDNGVLRGYNTDWMGIVTPLSQKTSLAGKRVAIMGAGGAARAAAFGLIEQRCLLKIFNRSLEHAEALGRAVPCPFDSLDARDEVREFDIVINVTPLGTYPRDQLSVLEPEQIRPGQIIFDTVYTPAETKLLQNARAREATVIPGIEMLLYQGVAQFELYTGQKAPVDVMRKVLKDYVEAGSK